MGFFTSARRNRCVTLRPGSERKMERSPKVLMEDPLAARSVDEDAADLLCADDAGKTDTSAPLSTRNVRRKRLQKTDSAPS